MAEEPYEFAEEPEHDPIEAIHDVSQAEPDYDNINDERKIRRMEDQANPPEPESLSEWMERAKIYEDEGAVSFSMIVWEGLIERVKKLEGG